MTPTPTGWCWGCGRALDVGLATFQALFCRLQCERRWERDQNALEKQVVRKGKREGYGVGGSTH